MTPYSWSWIFIYHASLALSAFGHLVRIEDVHLPTRQLLQPDPSSPPSSQPSSHKKRDIAIAMGLLGALVLLLSLFGLFLFLRKRRRLARGLEDGVQDQGNHHWRMFDQKKSEKTTDWWKMDHEIPPRIEPKEPKSGNLDRLRAMTRKGQRDKENDDLSSIPIQAPPMTPSPTGGLVIPLPVVPKPAQRYPSILERDRKQPSIPSINLPLPSSPLVPEEDTKSRRKVKVPPRALIVLPHGRPVPGLSERKIKTPDTPTTPSRRRRSWLSRHPFRHPFLPLKDSDSSFPPISAPIPSNVNLSLHQTGLLSAGYKPPKTPTSPGGPRSASSARRIKVPDYLDRRPPPIPIPSHMRELVLSAKNDARRLKSPSSPRTPRTPSGRQSPAPI